VPKTSPNYRAACVHATRVAGVVGAPFSVLFGFMAPFLETHPKTPAEATTMKEIAIALGNNKRTNESAAVYQRVVASYPNDQEALEALKGLRPEERAASAAASPMKGKRFTEILVAKGRIPQARLSQVMSLQKELVNDDLALGEALIADGSVSELDVVRALSEQTAIPFISGPRLFSTASKDAAALLRVDKAETWKVLPVSLIDRHLYVAMRDPRSFAMIDQLRFATGVKQIHGVFASESTLRKGIRKMYYGEEPSDPNAEDWRSWDQMPEISVSRFSDRYTGTREHEFDTQEMQARAEALASRPAMATPPSKAPAQATGNPVPRPSGPPVPQTARAMEVPPPQPTVGSVVASRYRLDKMLGEGGSAVVFQAHDLELDEPVALKLFGHTASAEERVARFKMELSLSRQLTHPNIIRLFDLGADGPWRYLTMELLEGTDVASHIDRLGGAMPLSEGLAVMLQACEGLQAAHDRGVIHRDVKPQNLFMTTSGTVKLMDFGIAKRERTQHITTEGVIAGTPEYMSPEQINGFSTVTHLTDIYGLGATAFTVFTGRPPFTAPEVMAVLMAQMNSPPPSPRERNPKIPVELENVMLKLMEKNPANRFQSCRALAQELMAIRPKLT
jgi:serine/threonine-protein kinase